MDFSGWERQVLKAIGAPVTASNVFFLARWHAAEQSAARNNPLNTTIAWPGATALPGNSAGVKSYPTPAAGATATARTLLNGNYTGIVAGLRSGRTPPTRLRDLVYASPWGTHTGITVDNRVAAGGGGRTPVRPSGGYVNPVPPGSTYERIDQGVDTITTLPVRAPVPGTIFKVSPAGSWAGGTGEAAYERFDKPLAVNGRTYYGGYFAEEHPLVPEGAHVTAGQPVLAAGGNELGFLVGPSLQLPALIGGKGAGTQETQAGRDFASFLRALGFSAIPSRIPAASGVKPGSPARTMASATGAPSSQCQGHCRPGYTYDPSGTPGTNVTSKFHASDPTAGLVMEVATCDGAKGACYQTSGPNSVSSAVTDLFGQFTTWLEHEASYAGLWLLFMLLGFGLMFAGLNRAFGIREKAQAAVVQAGAAEGGAAVAA